MLIYSWSLSTIPPTAFCILRRCGGFLYLFFNSLVVISLSFVVLRLFSHPSVLQKELLYRYKFVVSVKEVSSESSYVIILTCGLLSVFSNFPYDFPLELLFMVFACTFTYHTVVYFLVFILLLFYNIIPLYLKIFCIIFLNLLRLDL